MTTQADILVEVGGDVTPLQRAMRQGGRSLDTFSQKGARVARRMAKVGTAVVAAMTIGATAATGLARKSADAAVEIANLARVAGTTPSEFQKMAAGARTVGIEHDKLSDILKDVQDRIGDFMETGGGPMADFFENIAPKVGVTADQFARLSGPEALQLYVTSLEKANLSQSQMTFYLETMASDTTALLPLLRDGGRAMRELGDAAASSGRILSDETIEGAEKLKRTLDELEEQVRTEMTTALVGLEDEIVILAQFVKDYGVPALEGLIKLAAGAAENFEKLAKVIQIVRGDATAVGGDVANALGDQLGIDPNGPTTIDPLNDPAVANNGATNDALLDLYGGAGEGDAPGIAPENLLPPSPDPFNAPLRDDIPSPTGFDGPPSRSGSSGRSGPTEEDLEALAQSLATERELIEADYQERLAALDEFKAAEIGEKEKWNDLEARIEKDHADKLARLEEQKRAAKMQAMAGAFGDLSSLMQSENKKLFKIGKAAAIAEAVITGYEAAVDAWGKGMKIGGPPVAAAFTAASLAKTGMLISSIKSSGASGGGGGGGGGGGVPSGSSAETSAPVAAQQVNLSIGDAEWLPNSAVRSLAEKLQELSRQGAIVTVN